MTDHLRVLINLFWSTSSLPPVPHPHNVDVRLPPTNRCHTDHMVIPTYFNHERQVFCNSYLGCGFSRDLLSSPQVAWGSPHRQKYITARDCRLHPSLFIWRSPFGLVLYLLNISPLVLLTVGFSPFISPSGWGTKRYGCSAEFHCIRAIGMVEQFLQRSTPVYGTSNLKGCKHARRRASGKKKTSRDKVTRAIVL